MSLEKFLEKVDSCKHEPWEFFAPLQINRDVGNYYYRIHIRDMMEENGIKWATIKPATKTTKAKRKRAQVNKTRLIINVIEDITNKSFRVSENKEYKFDVTTETMKAFKQLRAEGVDITKSLIMKQVNKYISKDGYVRGRFEFLENLPNESAINDLMGKVLVESVAVPEESAAEEEAMKESTEEANDPNKEERERSITIRANKEAEKMKRTHYACLARENKNYHTAENHFITISESFKNSPDKCQIRRKIIGETIEWIGNELSKNLIKLPDSEKAHEMSKEELAELFQ